MGFRLLAKGHNVSLHGKNDLISELRFDLLPPDVR